MNKLEQYILKYQALHNGTEQFLTDGTSPKYNNTDPSKDKVLFDGSQLGKKLPLFIQQVIDSKQRAITLLDYGCGKAIHVYLPLKEHGKKTLLGRFDGMIQCYYCYDPAVEKYKVKPPQGMVFDLVCCADVMEHIPEENVPDVLKEIYSHTKHDGAAVFTISGNPARKQFIDGENLHITVKSVEWWIDIFKQTFTDKSFCILYNDESKQDEPIRVRYYNAPQFPVWSFESTNITINNTAAQVESL